MYTYICKFTNSSLEKIYTSFLKLFPSKKYAYAER